jgi:hypothetical protein
MINKYKILFDFLKPKIGPDTARIIIYDVLCDDTNKYCQNTIHIFYDWGSYKFRGKQINSRWRAQSKIRSHFRIQEKKLNKYSCYLSNFAFYLLEYCSENFCEYPKNEIASIMDLQADYERSLI